MTLEAGSRLGPYEISGPLGAGGMGEVYRARDTRLDRTVAIKILPARLSGDPALRQRFEREARAVSSLSHPNICVLHDIGREGDVDYLVMEYLEGETLASRLERGPLDLAETLRIGGEIADALDKAHRQGLVHRDLKPGNVMLTKSGAKLLDFGLAKQTGDILAASPITAAPTATSPLTAEGTLLGTLQYMSPEQLEGSEADGRSDIFALGALLYESATGKRAFEGRTQASVIAAILKEHPRPVSALQPLSPPGLDRLVQVCLAKDPDERWQSAGDLRRELEWLAKGGAEVRRDEPAAKSHRWRTWWVVALVGWALAIAGFLLYVFDSREPGARPGPLRVDIRPPEDHRFADFTFFGKLSVSPDGRRVAFIAEGAGERRIWVRDLGAPEARPLEGTQRADRPFWSSDGRFIGFFADGKLKKIPASGGVAQAICDAPGGRGGTWNDEGIIVFAPENLGALHKVSDGGGESVRVTTVQGENVTHRFPHFLPDGRHFLFLRSEPLREPPISEVFVASLDDPQPKRVLENWTGAVFSARHLLFERDGSLFAQPFDLKRLALVGAPVPLAQGLERNATMGSANFSASREGVIAFRTAFAVKRRFLWLDRTGAQTGTLGEADSFRAIRLSPDGREVLTGRIDPDTGEQSLWLMHAADGSLSPVVFPTARIHTGAWSTDGERIIVAGFGGPLKMLTLETGDVTQILATEGMTLVYDWSADGRYLLLEAPNPGTRGDVMALDLEDGGELLPVVRTESLDWPGRLSPNGRFVTYFSGQGDPEAYVGQLFVTEFPGPGGTWQVSTDGTWIGELSLSAWSHDGQELYYVDDRSRLMAVDVDTRRGFRASPPRALFSPPGGIHFVDAHPDGRILVLVRADDQDAPPISLIVDWPAELERRRRDRAR